MGLDQPVTLLAGALFVMMLVVSIMCSLRMPASFFEKQRQRDELRRALLKKRIIPPDENAEDNGE